MKKTLSRSAVFVERYVCMLHARFSMTVRSDLIIIFPDGLTVPARTICNHNRRTVAGCLHGRLTPGRVLRQLRTEVSLTPLSVIAHPPVAIRRSGCISQVARPARATTGTYLLLGIRFSMSRRYDSPGSKGEIVLLYHVGTLLSRGYKEIFLYFSSSAIRLLLNKNRWFKPSKEGDGSD